MLKERSNTYFFTRRKILYGSSVNIYKKKGSLCEYFKYKKRYHLLKNYKTVRILKRSSSGGGNCRSGGGEHGDCVVCLQELSKNGIYVCPPNSCSANVCSKECREALRRYSNKCPQCRGVAAPATSNTRTPTALHMRLVERGEARRVEEARRATEASRQSTRPSTRQSTRPPTASRQSMRQYIRPSTATQQTTATRQSMRQTTATRAYDSVSALDIEIRRLQRQ